MNAISSLLSTLLVSVEGARQAGRERLSFSRVFRCTERRGLSSLSDGWLLIPRPCPHGNIRGIKGGVANENSNLVPQKDKVEVDPFEVLKKDLSIGD